MLTCKASKRGRTIYTFYHNGRKAQSGPKNKMYLKHLKKAHLGRYRCRATIGGKHGLSAIYQLYVKATTPLKAILKPNNPSKVLSAGSTQLLTCKSSRPGKKCIYTFWHNGRKIQSGHKNQLWLRKMKPSKRGNYQCRVTLNGKKANSNVYKLVIKAHPKLTATLKPSSPKSKMVEGSSQTLTCFTDIPGKITYTFYRNGRKIQHGSKNKLHLKKLKMSHRGNYQCRVTLKGRHAKTNIYKLIVSHSKPTTPTLKPVKPATTLVGGHGTTQTLICHSKTPKVVYTFYRSGKKLQTGKSNKLVLKNLSPKSAGKYYCAATCHGKLSKPSNFYNLIVKIPTPVAPGCVATFPKGGPTIGGKMTLHCKSKVPGFKTYHFFHNGKKIRSSKNPRLVIRITNKSKAGKYSCKVGVNGITSSLGGSVNVVIKAPLKCTLKPSNPSKVLSEGTTQLLTCKSSRPGKKCIYTFWHNGRKIQSGHKNQLWLRKMKPSKRGNYQCRVTLNGKKANSNVYKLVIKAHPKLTANLKPSSPKSTMAPGSSQTLTCFTDVPGKITYTFYHNGRKIQHGSKNKLHLKNVKMRHRGNYQCRVTHKGRHAKTKVYKLIVKFPTPVAPGCVATFPKGGPTIGGKMTLHCKSKVPGFKTYHFFHNGKKIRSSKNPKLVIRIKNKKQAGKYSCKVGVNGMTSSLGGSVTIVVKAKPLLAPKCDLTFDKMGLFVGGKMTLHCKSKATGKKTYFFFHNGKKIRHSNNPKMVIKFTSKKQAGKYSCKVGVKGKTSPMSPINNIVIKAPVVAPKCEVTFPKGGLSIGGKMTLHCKSKVSGRKTYHFFHNGKKIKSSKNPELVIKITGKKEAGKYSCKVGAHGKTSPMSGTTNIIIKVPPKKPVLVPSKPGNTLPGGSHQTLTCKSSAKGKKTYIFFKNGKKIRENGNHELELNSLQKSEAGKYSCAVKVDGLKSPPSNTYTLTVKVVTIHTPTLKPANAKTEMPAGLDQILVCETKNKGDLLYTFLKNGKVVKNGKDNKLVLQDICPADSAKYACFTTLEGKHSKHSNAYTLKVKVSLERPTLSCSCTSSHVWVDESVTLNCGGKATKHITYIFYKGDKEIHKGASSKFTIKNAKAGDAGVYTCKSVSHGHKSEASNKFPIQIMKKCNAHIDLLFLVDKSASIQPHQFKKSKEFMQKMIAKFEVKSDVVRVGTVLFANGPHNGFCFNKYMNKPALEKAVGALSCPKCKRGKTATGAALQYARENSLTDACGAREDAKKIIVVITDGKSTEDADYVKEQAEEMKMIADEVLSVGVGKIKRSELEMIATQDEYVFTTDDFSKLDGLLNNVATKTCEAGAAGSDYDTDHDGDYEEGEDWDEGLDGDWDDSDEMDWEWDRKK